MSDAPTADASAETETDVEQAPSDAVREALIAELADHLGDALVDQHIVPGHEAWIRVATDSWKHTARVLHSRGFHFFSFLSAIDWLPSPYGRGEDNPDDEPEEPDTTIRQGYTGGDTRFQVFARVVDVERHLGVTVKADIPDDTMTVDSWIEVYAGANWHEREANEMFGINFIGHPDLRHIYLPGDFEGHPLRKDFPLLARMIKPWPGIVDVEPLPPEPEEEPEEIASSSEADGAADGDPAATEGDDAS